MKKILYSLSAIILLGFIATGASIALAHNNQISQGLGPGEKQAFFEKKLDTSIDNGEITQEQKQALLSKKEEMREDFEALKDLPKEERFEKMKELKQEVSQWMKDNGIEIESFGKNKRFYKGHNCPFNK